MEPVDFGTVRRSVVLPAPVEVVWGALIGAEELSAWFGGDVEIDPIPGGQIVVQEGERARRGVIVDLVPLRHLEIRWLPASRRIGFVWGPDDAPAGGSGAVEFFLEPLSGRRSRVTVVERPPVAAPAAVASAR